ncbi:MAG: right-handed parallel beta-helix repeat-containing protein [Candidatus Hodarchaeales archaeon]
MRGNVVSQTGMIQRTGINLKFARERKIKICQLILAGLLVNYLLLSINSAPTNSASLTENENYTPTLEMQENNRKIDQLTIEGNAKLLSMADYYNWSGNGSVLDPIQIKNVTFHGRSQSSALSLKDCSLYVEFFSCAFTGSNNEYTYPNPEPAGLQLEKCSNIRVYHSEMFLNLEHGLYMKECRDISFLTCNFSKNSENGIRIAKSCFNISFYDSSICLNGETGIDISLNSQGCIINSSHIQNNLLKGLDIGYTCNSNTITNSTINNNGYYGISISSSQCWIVNNSFSKNSKGDLLLSESSERNLISDNIFEEGGGIYAPVDDYYFPKDEPNILERNFVGNQPIILLHKVTTYEFPTNPGQIILQECNSLELVNLLFEATFIGLYLGGCQDITIKECFFSNNTEAGLYIVESNRIEVKHSIFSQNKGYGIKSFDSQETLYQDNSFVANQRGGFYCDSYEGNRSFKDNRFENDGIFFNYLSPDFVEFDNNSINGKPLVLMIQESNNYYNYSFTVGMLILYKCTNLTFDSLRITNTYLSVLLIASTKIRFYNCEFVNNAFDIFSQGGLAGSLEYYNRKIEIENCTFINTRVRSISFSFTHESRVVHSKFFGDVNLIAEGISIFKSSDNLVIGCTLTSLEIGIYLLIDCYNNNILNCTFLDCGDYGLILSAIALENLIQYNNFIRTEAADDTYRYDISSPRNTFVNNYWSEGDHTDANGDGIADNPHKIEISRDDLTPGFLLHNYDEKPLIEPTLFDLEAVPEFDTTTTTSPIGASAQSLIFIVCLCIILFALSRRIIK